MTNYVVEYKTENIYEKPVRQAAYELLILPCETPFQKVYQTDISHSLDEKLFYTWNKYSFSTLHLHTSEYFNRFSLQMRASVSKIQPEKPLAGFHDSMNDYLSLEDESFQITNQSFLKSTELTHLDKKLLPETFFRAEREPVYLYVPRLMALLYSYLTYVQGSTSPYTSAQEALVLRMGVCQDFSHIFLGLLRSQGIPSRYTSGYLYVGPERDASQLHAWVEVFIPHLVWLGFDAANNIEENERYIKIAHGRDYADCKPIKGVISTEGEHTTAYEVRVLFEKDYVQSIQQQQQ